MVKVRNLKNEEVEFAGFTFGPLAEGFVNDESAEGFKGLENFEVLEVEKKAKKESKKK